MPSSATVRRWQDRLELPVMLAVLWFVLYTSYMVFGIAFGNPEESAVRILFSSEHLSLLRGWLFLLSLIVSVVGGLFHTYVVVSGH